VSNHCLQTCRGRQPAGHCIGRITCQTTHPNQDDDDSREKSPSLADALEAADGLLDEASPSEESNFLSICGR